MNAQTVINRDEIVRYMQRIDIQKASYVKSYF